MTRSRTESGATARRRFDTRHATATEGLTNARTRIVGNRSGLLADGFVALVRVAGTVGAWIANWFGRVSSVVTPLGWTMIALVPAAFAVGYGLGWIEFVVIAWSGLALLVVAGLYLLPSTALEAELRLPRPRVVAGDAAVGEILARNPSRRKSTGVAVEVPVGDGLAEAIVPALGGGESHATEFAIPAPRRGVVPVGPVRSVRADPVGLVRRELVWTAPSELIVHPRTIAVPSTSTGIVRDLEGNPTRDLTSSDVAFHALREYAPGDERRYIHWRSTAKTGTYMVRQFEQTRRSHLVVGLSLATGDYGDDEEFELAVSVVASIGARAIRDARDVSVVVSERTPEFAKRKLFAVRSLSTVSPGRLLDDLARVEHAESALGVADIARVTSGRVEGISVAFLVCGSAPTVGQLRQAAAQFPAGVEVVAVVCDPETVPGLRRAAGFSVLTVGYLNDLQHALARSAAA